MRTAKKTLMLVIFLLILSPAGLTAQEATPGNVDPYLWLEDVEGKDALEWVEKHNAATMDEFKEDSVFLHYQDEALKILNAKDRIPYGGFRGDYIYNFWQDEEHARGILRRTTLDEYQKKNPQWELVLDIDKLNQEEGKSWVYMGSTPLPPDYKMGLISLSPGGKDAAVVREFDFEKKAFVEGGFYLPEAKSSADWYDANTLIIGTDFGPGTLTSSGYPRIIKLWKRGTDLADAITLLEGEESDVAVEGGLEYRPEGSILYLNRAVSFWESINWIVDKDLNKIEVPIPKDAQPAAFFKNHAIILLHSDWLGIPEGSLIALKINDFKAEDLRSKIDVLFQPDDKSTVEQIVATRDYLVVTILRNVNGEAIFFKLTDSPGAPKWTQGKIDLPAFGSIGIMSACEAHDMVMISYQSFLSPTKLFFLTDPEAAPKEINALPEWFDASNLEVNQYQTTSLDGTVIPYFLISQKGMKLDGKNPTLLYGYGGFRASETPFYSGTVGKLWLESGGVYALANIRGGGEFGPRWHKAALLENRQKSFDDFIAVAEDLIKRKIT